MSADIITLLNEGNHEVEVKGTGLFVNKFGRSPDLVGPDARQTSPLERRRIQQLYEKRNALTLEKVILEGRMAAAAYGIESEEYAIDRPVRDVALEVGKALMDLPMGSNPLLQMSSDKFGAVVLDFSKFSFLVSTLGKSSFDPAAVDAQNFIVTIQSDEGAGSILEVTALPNILSSEHADFGPKSIGSSVIVDKLSTFSLTVPKDAHEFTVLAGGVGDGGSIVFTQPGFAQETFDYYREQLKGQQAAFAEMNLANGLRGISSIDEERFILIYILEDEENSGDSQVMIQVSSQNLVDR